MLELKKVYEGSERALGYQKSCYAEELKKCTKTMGKIM
jgi:hypothetical protein